MGDSELLSHADSEAYLRSRIKVRGECAELLCRRDWSHTNLGSPETWPTSRFDTLEFMLASPVPKAIYYGAELHILYNDAYRAVAGERHPAKFGVPAEMFWREAWAFLQDPLEKCLRQGLTQAGEAMLVPIEVEGKLQDRYWDYSFSPVFEDGEIVAVANLSISATERVKVARALQASEARTRRILDSIGDAVIVTDLASRVTMINPVAEALTGWNAAAARGKLLGEVLPLFTEAGDDTPGNRGLPATLRFCTHSEAPFVIQKSDGTEILLDQTCALVTDESGTPDAMVLTFRDITARQVAERRLRQAYKMETLGQLTGGIAHDFNNILAIIMGNLEAIAELRPRDLELRHYIEQTVVSAERAADLTRRLLAYARQQRLEPVILDLRTFLPVATDFIRRALGPGIVIQASFSMDLWSARIDRSQFENALLNLAVNARDAMQEGGRLTLQSRNLDLTAPLTDPTGTLKPGQYVVVSVVDTGCGMTQEAILRATEPFFTTKPVGQGTGLGLSMVYGFIEQSGGHIRIESEVGQGTSVSLYLPRAVSEVDAGREGGALRSASPRGTEVILMVEDEIGIRRSVSMVLRGLGYTVLEAEDYPTAMQHLRSTMPIDLLLTDVVLPDAQSGITVANEAQELRSGLKIIFSSGYTSNVLTRDYHLQEGVNLLRKPYRMADLAVLIREVLDQPNPVPGTSNGQLPLTRSSPDQTSSA